MQRWCRVKAGRNGACVGGGGGRSGYSGSDGVGGVDGSGDGGGVTSDIGHRRDVPDGGGARGDVGYRKGVLKDGEGSWRIILRPT